MKIAILSDTHDLLRPEVKKVISECDGLIHGGDVCSPQVWDEIKSCIGPDKPFYLVRGNNDRAWGKDLPFSLTFTIEGVKFFLVHNQKNIPKDLQDVQIVIYGHSHKYAEEMKDGRLWLNPGSCGKRRFHLPITMAVLYLEESLKACEKAVSLRECAKKFSWHVERIELEGEAKNSRMGMTQQKNVDFTEGKLVGIVTEIFVRMDKGQTISYIAEKVGMDAELVEQICRIRVTHPGVTPNGVVDKMEVNKIVIKSSK